MIKEIEEFESGYRQVLIALSINTEKSKFHDFHSLFLF